MKKNFFSLLLAAAVTASCINIPFVQSAAQIVAFPGAEGGGKYATGGRGGKVVHVTNLNDSGAGSFRDAVSGSNRIVVFDVGGTITLKSDVVVKSNITILGQTAPGGAGITLAGRKLGQGGDNQIIRFISSRPGERGSGEYDAWGGSNGSNSIIDHCSIGWGNDEQWGLYSNNMNQTVQYSIIGPSNCVSTHAKGLHGFGVMFGKGQNSWHHNMIAHNISRNFRGKVEKTNSMDFVNNVMYDWGYQTGYGTLGHINYVGNYLKAGNGTKGSYHFMVRSSGSAIENYKFFVNGNTIRKKDGTVYSSDIEKDNWGGVGFDENVYRSQEYFPVYDINGNDASVAPNAQTAEEAFETVLKYAGAGINSDARPRIDREVMEEARTGTGYLTGACVDSVTDSEQKKAISTYNIKQVNYDEYYPAAVQKQITDSDNDGMPDEWEIARGLDPNKDDASGDYLGRGYMNIEYYANDLTVDAFPAGVVELSPESVDLGPEYDSIKEEMANLTLSVSAIKTPADLVLPQKGSTHNLDITWSSSSSAIKIRNNQISDVTRKSDNQNVTLTANISYGGYTMNKTFSVIVVSDTNIWKASQADNGKPAGTELFDGLTTLFDATYKASDVTINNEAFAGYISSSANGTFSNGTVTGTAFKYTAEENGFLTAYITRLGAADKAKTLYIIEEGAAQESDCLAKVDGYASNESLTAQVRAGKTYYIYVAGSKGCFTGIEFSQNAKPKWWKADKDVALNSEMMKGLTPSEKLTYRESARDIDGESFTGCAAGSTNPSDNGASGAAIKYIPETDGLFTFYCKVGAGKTMKINDADGNVISEYKNETEESEFSSLSGNLKKGVTYYAYVAGSKAEFYGASFTMAAEPADDPTEPTNKPADPTDKPADPTDEPTNPTADPTDKPAEPTQVPTVPPIIPTDIPLVVCAEYADRLTAEFKVDNDGNAELNIQTVSEDDKITEEASVYAAYFDENGNLSGVEIVKADENGSFEFKINNGSYKVMLWDTGIKPIINAICGN